MSLVFRLTERTKINIRIFRAAGRMDTRISGSAMQKNDSYKKKKTKCSLII